MAIIKAILRVDKRRDKKTGSVFVRYSHACKQIEFSVGERVAVLQWDSKNHRLKGRSAIAMLINDVIQKKMEEVNTMRLTLKSSLGREPSTDEMAVYCGKSIELTPILPIFKNIISSIYNSELKQSTIGTYHALISNLTAFEVSKGLLFLQELDRNKYSDIYIFFIEEHGMLPQTAKRYMGLLKMLVKTYNRKNDIPICDDFSKVDFHKNKKTNKQVILTLDEINLFFQFNYDRHHHRIALDLFKAQFYSGLRISDLHQLRLDQIIKEDGIEFIQICMTKTSGKLMCPILPPLKQILDHYPDGLPKIETNTYNHRLRIMAKLAGFNDPISILKMEQGKPIEITVPKWKLITSHVARRSFASLLFEQNLSEKDIQFLLGHSNSDVTRKHYIKNQQKNQLLSLFATFAQALNLQSEEADN